MYVSSLLYQVREQCTGSIYLSAKNSVGKKSAIHSQTIKVPSPS